MTLREALGAEIMVHFSVDAPPAFTADVKELAEDVGDAERTEAHARESSAAVVGRFGARSRVKPGDQVDVAVDTRQLHFFDVESGARHLRRRRLSRRSRINPSRRRR